MGMKQFWIAVCALALAACDTGPEWTRDGATPQETQEALSECQSAARAATQRDTDIMTDIMASRGGDWQRTGVKDTHAQLFSVEDRDRSGDIVTRCMVGKGYAPGG